MALLVIREKVVDNAVHVPDIRGCRVEPRAVDDHAVQKIACGGDTQPTIALEGFVATSNEGADELLEQGLTRPRAEANCALPVLQRHFPVGERARRET